MKVFIGLALLQMFTLSANARVIGAPHTDPESITSTIFLYVNDSSTSGDVYTTAPGSVLNPGIYPSAPAASLQWIFDSYNLVDGDYIIFVDTGIYTNSILIREDDGASSLAPNIIIGSTNDQAGGSLFYPSIHPMTGAVFRVSKATNIIINNVRVRSGGYGFVFDGGATNCALVQCRAESNAVAGVRVFGPSTAVSVSNCVIYGTGPFGARLESGSMRLVNNTIFGQTGQSIRVDSGFLHAAQNIILSRSPASTCVAKYGGIYLGDYNNLAHGAGSAVGFINGVGSLATLMDWQTQTGQDTNSISLDPMLANELSGNAHLRSMAGRYNPSGGVFVIDGVHSPSIDAGNPLSAFGTEPHPNGNRINQGAYGNTGKASKSRTNGTLHVRSFSDGGSLQGESTLTWFAQGAVMGHTLTLQYSIDHGYTWTVIASNVSAATGMYKWDTFLAHDTRQGIWRIMSEADHTVMSQSGPGFSINSGLTFESPHDASRATMSWYGETGRLYRLISPTGILAGSWAPSADVIFSNGTPFTIATGANARIVVEHTNITAKDTFFFGLEAAYPAP